jgi:hypothetical protein
VSDDLCTYGVEPVVAGRVVEVPVGINQVRNRPSTCASSTSSM